MSVRKTSDPWNLAGWADGYFAQNTAGQLTVLPDRERALVLADLIKDLDRRDLGTPLLLRFDDILRDRAERLHTVFTQAKQAREYAADYTPVYPIKVNQQRSVIDAILSIDAPVGLEAGSKPELLAVLGVAAPGSIVVCNGYKDREYIRLALFGRKLGLDVRIVIEKPAELRHVLEQAEELGVAPCLGVRARLASIGAGRWQNTGGEKSKFGLYVEQWQQLVSELQAVGKLEWLRMLHVHMGSQISDLADLKIGLVEATRHYLALVELGAPLDSLDVGGGLAVDYQGSHSSDVCSMNYGLEDYAEAVIDAVADGCAEAKVAVPAILTEAGRAMTAQHAVLIADVVDVESRGEDSPDKLFANFSLFQSLPDAWAIEQVFPIAPLQRLDEAPTRQATIVDLTCDSDGRIDQYVTVGGLAKSLPVHAIADPSQGEPYLLGFFLIGAYQEVLGDIHNLFGDTNAANIRLTEEGYAIHDTEQGDTAAELLAYVHHDPDKLREAYANRVKAAGIEAQEGAGILLELETRLTDDTYLNR